MIEETPLTTFHKLKRKVLNTFTCEHDYKLKQVTGHFNRKNRKLFDILQMIMARRRNG